VTGRFGPEPSPPSRTLTAGVWAITFGYAAVSALLIQLVILPHVFPAWHAGRGLLVGGDWIAFHNYAVKRAQRIQAEGWRAFELRPMGQAPIGIASAMYRLTWSEPWVLIPLNAALHATAAVLLFHLLRGFVADWRWAALGTAPFVFYPTVLTWVSQIHKDGFFITGYLCQFVAWANLARMDPRAWTWRSLGRTVLLLLVGFGLVWLVRPDLTRVGHASAGLALGVLAVRIAARSRRDPPGWRRGVAVLALVVVATLVITWLTSAPARFDAAPMMTSGQEHRGIAPPLLLIPDGVSSGDELKRGVDAIPWYRSAWLPAAVDWRIFYRIALTREMFHVNYLDSRSNVDVDVGFYRAADLLRYLPRALQVALLAPFPADWRQTGSAAWTTAGRRAVAVEMLGVYVALLALLAVAWQWRRRAELWIVVLPCLAILGVYSLAVPNLGALHRFRYGFLMTLVGLGVAGGLELLSRRVGRKARPRRDPAHPRARSA
jgi:hypothetical protein